jgi:hypothetical protein
MPQRDKMVCLLFGVVELAGAALWCVAGAGIYGSPLEGMSDDQLAKVWLFLAVGPLSVLPAALTMLWHRRLGAAWLLVGGAASGAMAVTWFLADRGVLVGPLVSVPMIGVGLWQLVSRSGPAPADARPLAARAGSMALGVARFLVGWVGTYALLLVLILNDVTGLRGEPGADLLPQNADFADTVVVLSVGALVAVLTLLRARLRLRWELLAGQWVAVLLAALVIRASLGG